MAEETPRSVALVTPPVPAPLTGLWRREEMSTPNGDRDVTTRVLWLQTQRFYVDIRLQADRPVRHDASSFEAYGEEELLRLAMVQGFAGVLTVTGGVCLWRRELDYQPPAPTPDEARFEIEGDRMTEFGIHADYTEIWRREPDSQRRLAAFRRDNGLGGLLVIGGDHFLSIEGRDQPLPPGTDLPSIVRRDLDDGRRDLAVARLRMEISYGRIAGGERPWQVQLSTWPWREGRGLFAGPTSFDPTTGQLMSAAGRRWSLVDSDVEPDGLIPLFQSV